jgi:hypothetical protein
MFIATMIVSGLVALILVVSASAKLAKSAQIMAIMATVGFPEDKLWLLAAAEIAGAAGLVIGLIWWQIGVAATTGVILYFIGAVGAHVRVKDKNLAPALILLFAAVAALALRVLSI